MKRMKKFILAGVLCAICAVLFACGKKTEQKYDYLVTFDYNLGSAIESNCRDQYLGVNDGSLLIQPGDNSSFVLQPVMGYYNEGWYLPQTGEDGSPLTDETGRVLLGEKWDFSADRVNSEITLYANFLINPTLTVVVEGGDNIEYSYAPGYERDRPGSDPKSEGNTFFDYYSDPEFTSLFEWPYVFTTENKTIYARFIPGIWEVVREPKELTSTLARNSSANIYLAADLDFSKVDWIKPATYSGTFEGNGHKISNVNYQIDQVRQQVSDFALFGTLKSGASIKNVNFENCNLEFTAHFNQQHDVALLVWKLESGATLSGLTVSGSVSDKTSSSAIFVNLHELCAVIESGSVITDCDYSGVNLIPRT